MLENYAHRLSRRVRKYLAEAEEALGEEEQRAAGAPSAAATAGLCLSGVRQNLEGLMNACDMAYGSLGQGQPFRMYFQHADAPAMTRR